MAKTAIAIASTLVPGVASAHPQHGNVGDSSLFHFLTDPFHVGLTVAAILIVLAARRSSLRRRPARSLARSTRRIA